MTVADDDRITELERKVAQLQRELTYAEERAHVRNVEMDALHYVWCDGGCRGGVHRWTEGVITEELVASAERQVRRLRRWYDVAKFKQANGSPAAHEKAV